MLHPASRRLAVPVLCLLAGLHAPLVGAARAQAPAPAPAQPQTLAIGLSAEPDTLDPTLSGSYYSRVVFAALCDKLVDINEKLEIVPQLATSWQWVDQKTLVMHLRAGVLFQDGERLDAAAVKATLERDLTLPGSYRRAEISAIDHVDVLDPLTVRIALSSADSPLLAQLADRAGMIMAPQAAATEGADFGLHPVCAGPFAFKDRVAQDHITLTRFPQYWDAARIHFDTVTYRTMPSGSVRLANLQAGAIDIADQIDPSDVPTVQRDARLAVMPSDSLGYYSLLFNVANGPASAGPTGQSALVRQAFALGIDRAALSQVVFGGLFKPDAQAMPTESPFYVPALPAPGRDVARARALLKQAGVATPVAVNFLVQNSPLLQQEAEVIQSMEAEVGFAVHITAIEFAASFPANRNGQFQLTMQNWSGRIDPDGNLYPFLDSAGAANYGHWVSPAVDRLLDQGRQVADVAQRRDIYAQVYRQVAQEGTWIYLLDPQNLPGVSRRITGFRPVPDGLIRLQEVAVRQGP